MTFRMRAARSVAALVVMVVLSNACSGSSVLEVGAAPTAAEPLATATAEPAPTPEPTAETPSPSPTNAPAPTEVSTVTPAPTATPFPAATAEPIPVPVEPDTNTGSAELATPEETALTVFFRLAESLLGATDSPYAGTSPEVLTESAHASCRILLAGGDIRSAIEAAVAASPLAGQTFASSEQQYVLLVVTRGAKLWCPDVITDEEAFTAEVISTLVDVFFDG